MSQRPLIPGVNRLLVFAPSWIGDAVMATPTLRALRGLYPQAQLTVLAKRLVRPVLDACPWVDRFVTLRRRRSGEAGSGDGALRLGRRLAARGFDLVVLLPNSFRAALVARLTGAPRRLGYDRDGRGFLLTDHIAPPRREGRLVPTSTLQYYLDLARYLGAEDPDPTMQLFTRPQDDRAAAAVLASVGYGADDQRPLVLITPGANYGDAKLWSPERFARVADDLSDRCGAAVAMAGSPRERPILDRVAAASGRGVMDLSAAGMTLAQLKSVVGRASLVICNDTGPRHVAAAMGTPVVSIFGPTDPAWTTIDFEHERQVRIDVFCGPCQKKVCPLDHRCMTGIDASMVLGEAEALLAGAATGPGAGDRPGAADRPRLSS